MLESSQTEQVSTVDGALTPGGQLRAAREQTQLSITAVAAELKLTEAYLEALEGDHFESLPAEPFVLGYLRAYARMLGLDAQQVVDLYHDYGRSLSGSTGGASKRGVARKLTSARAKPAATDTEASAQKTSAMGYGGWVVIAGLLLWVAASMWLSESATSVAEQALPAAEKPMAEPEAAESPANTLAVVNEVASASADVLKADTVASESETVEPELAERPADSDTELAATALTDTAPAAQSVAELDTLQLSFTDECWLEVTDSRGDVLNADLYQAGESTTLQGRAPFNVMIGNVRAVSARLNDQVLQLNPNGFRKTLRLRIASVSDIEVLARRNPGRED